MLQCIPMSDIVYQPDAPAMQTATLFDPPAQRHSPTSVNAASEIRPKAATLRAKVLSYLLANGPQTDEEMQEGIPMPPSTQRPRRVELVRAGAVRDTGETRQTRSGRAAAVWSAVANG